MELRKCGECAHPQQADASIRRVVAGLLYCPETGEYVRADETQCRDFKSGETSKDVQEPRAREESYPTQGDLSR